MLGAGSEAIPQTETWSFFSLEVLSVGTPTAMLTKADFYQQSFGAHLRYETHNLLAPSLTHLPLGQRAFQCAQAFLCPDRGLSSMFSK